MGELGDRLVEEERRFIVLGRVQGVGFRWFVCEEARRLDVGGWTQNLPDGSVLVEAAARPTALDAFALRLREGPPASHVVDVRVEPRASSTPLPHPFRIHL